MCTDINIHTHIHIHADTYIKYIHTQHIHVESVLGIYGWSPTTGTGSCIYNVCSTS